MPVLVLDTSTPAVSVGLVGDDGDLLVERVVVDGRRHGELLAVGLHEVLAVAAPTGVVVGVGPGPFTGLRVGIMTAAVLAQTRGLPVVGVCSLDGLAGPDTVVMTDARRKEVYWAVYDAAGRRADGPHVTTPAVAAEAVQGRRVVGDGAVLHGLTDLEHPRYPSLARLAAAARTEPALALTPLYLRRPDAQEMAVR